MCKTTMTVAQVPYLIRYVIRSTVRYVTDHEKDPNVPTKRYVNVLKKTMRKTLITYLKPRYLRCFSPAPFWGYTQPTSDGG